MSIEICCLYVEIISLMNLCEYLNVDPKHLVQKVLPFRNKLDIQYPCIVQEKYDGVFCIAISIDNEIRFFSRTGKEYFSLNHLKQPFRTMLNSDYTFDKQMALFEAWIPKTSQEIISGYCRDKQNQHPEIIAVVHDYLTLSEYEGNKFSIYSVRFKILQSSIRLANDFLANPRVILPKTIFACNFDEIERFARQIWETGGEGIVIKNPLAHYQRGKRNTSMIKMKRGVSFDLEVTDVIEGTGKYVGMVGKLVCRFKNGTSILVGTGLLDIEREKYWKDKSLIIGKIVQVNAMQESKNGTLREPSYKGIRYDKECADY